jgi:hypothetical protein
MEADMNMFWVIPAVAIVSTFTFIAVAVWADSRRKEREAFYRHETYRKMLEQPGTSVDDVMRLMQQLVTDEENRRLRKDREGMKVGGLVTTAVGVALGIFLYAIEPDRPVYLVGLIPLAVGLALSYYAFVLAPVPGSPDASTSRSLGS